MPPARESGAFAYPDSKLDTNANKPYGLLVSVVEAPRTVRRGMPDSPERTALYRLYSTKAKKGLHPFLRDLYPNTIATQLYLGTAGSCPNDGPGLFYRPCDWESECVVTLGLDIRWGAPRAFKRPSVRVEAATCRTALYRLRDSAGRLLYVGIGRDPLRRWPEHAGDKPWWPEVADLSMEWFESRTEALGAEATAIRVERPRHNVIHNATND